MLSWTLMIGLHITDCWCTAYILQTAAGVHYTYYRQLVYINDRPTYCRLLVYINDRPTYCRLLVYSNGRPTYFRLLVYINDRPTYCRLLVYINDRPTYCRLLVYINDRPTYCRLLVYIYYIYVLQGASTELLAAARDGVWRLLINDGVDLNMMDEVSVFPKGIRNVLFLRHLREEFVKVG